MTAETNGDNGHFDYVTLWRMTSAPFSWLDADDVVRL